MEPNQTSVIPPTPPTPVPPAPTPEPEAKTSYGTLIALILVVLAIASGAFYFLRERIADLGIDAGQAAIRSLTDQSDSTEPEAIESDLSSEGPEELEAALRAAFSELDASFELE